MGHRMHYDMHHEKQEHPATVPHSLPHIGCIMAGRIWVCKAERDRKLDAAKEQRKNRRQRAA